MNNILHSFSSVVHLLAALTAISTGTYVLFTRKGTATHRFVGWLYAGSMGILLFTAFRIYVLWGGFGIIHWGAVGSVITLTVGLGAVGLRPFIRSWLRWHYLGMGASITGLYAAFVVECTYRFFAPVYFWWSTLGVSTVVFVAGGFLLHHHYPAWARQMSRRPGTIANRRLLYGHNS